MLTVISLIVNLSAGPVPAAGGEAARPVITVDCNAGDDLTRALTRARDRKGRPVVVEISGICETSLSIEMNDLTLRGDGTAVLRGPVGDAGPVVEINDSRNVVIEDLSVELAGPGTSTRILDVADSEFSLRNVAISNESGARIGLGAMRMLRSQGAVVDATIDVSSGGVPIVAGHGSRLDMVRVRLVAPYPEIGIVADSTASLDSVGLHAAPGSARLPYPGAAWGSSLDARDVEMDPGGNLRAWSESSVRFSNSTAAMATDLDVRATDHSSVYANHETHPKLVTLTESTGEIRGADTVVLSRFSDLQILGDVGALFVGEFSRALIRNPGTADLVSCETRADVVCPAGSVGSSSCSGCTGLSARSSEETRAPIGPDPRSLTEHERRLEALMREEAP